MKPIRLMIKGLNSFVEVQTIDFEKLTAKGLFGIFGPTGSGKSTILDGMTLALYGKNARDSSNYINTHCDMMDVSYEFQIRENISHHYIVERKFKRNKNNGIETKNARILERILGAEDVILAEGKVNTDKKCKEIIGLSFDDFIRTVVLPQGKFSEFLKLEGKERREMLERLFALDQYGSQLSNKLSRVMRVKKSEMDQLIGHLQGYEEISETLYKEESTQLKEKKQQEKSLKEVFDQFSKFYKEQETLWQYHKELQGYHKEQENLEAQKETVEQQKLSIKKGESVLKVFPYYERLESTKQTQNQTQKQLEKIMNTKENLKLQVEAANKRYKIAKNQKDEALPEFKVKQSKLEEALKEKQQLLVLQAQRKELLRAYKGLAEDKKVQELNQQQIQGKIEALELQVASNQKLQETFYVEEHYRVTLEEGLKHVMQLQSITKRKKQLEESMGILEKEQEVLQISLKKFSDSEQNLQQQLGDIDERITQLIQNAPDNDDTILELTKDLSKLEQVYKVGKQCEDELLEVGTKLTKYQQIETQLAHEKQVVEVEALALEVEVKEIEKQHLAQLLRKDLAVGSPCPVCGGTMHEMPRLEDTNDVKGLSLKKETLEKKMLQVKTLEMQCIENTVKRKEAKKKKKELEETLSELGSSWKNCNLEVLISNLENKKQALAQFKKDKESFEKKRLALTQEHNQVRIELGKIESSCKEKSKQYSDYSKDLSDVEHDYNLYFEKITRIKAELAVEDLEERHACIRNMDKQREEIEKQTKEDHARIKNYLSQKDSYVSAFQELTQKISGVETEGREKKNQIDEKCNSIREKVGERETDLDAYALEIVTAVAEIEKEFTTSETLKEQLEEQLTNISGQVMSYTHQLENLKISLQKEEKDCAVALIEEGFENVEQMLANQISKEKLGLLKETVEAYENNFWQLKGKIQEITHKINGRMLEKETWESLQGEKTEKEHQLDCLKEEIADSTAKLRVMRERLDTLKGLLEEKAKKEHELSLLNDLDNLFKGKKFVEFVAMYQLKYVSLEASKQLKSITNGNYGLEIDEAGRFIIRDYKNGGAIRDASTLSGGETFLASLALALALSAQIQLKGSAPLELFFLDEGFGTLDEKLLDVVMGSLEKLHHERFAIGIISHVDSIKNRVPVKLIVNAAEAGVSGSKVKVEIS